MNTSIKAFAQLSALVYLAFSFLLLIGESAESASIFLTVLAIVLPLVSKNVRLLYSRAYGFSA